ncbi:hypothetical protein EDB19DRAFT_1634183, partial [Suillus lakei]
DIVGARKTRKMNLYQVVRDNFSVALAKVDIAVIYGEGIVFDGVFRYIMGLAEEFCRQRVFNIPLTERGVAGFGIDPVSLGHTVIAEMEFADYIRLEFDQLRCVPSTSSHISNQCWTLLRRWKCRCANRTPDMAGYITQSPEQFFVGASGLKIAILCCPIQCNTLLLSPLRSQPSCSTLPSSNLSSARHTNPTHSRNRRPTLPFSRVETAIPGSDLTFLTWVTVHHCESALRLFNCV